MSEARPDSDPANGSDSNSGSPFTGRGGFFSAAPANEGEKDDSAAIVVENLVKRYPKICAVNDISFTVARGEVFGVLGPNGAGKTTTVEILEGLRSADSGTARVLGMDVRRDVRRVKERIGVALQTATLMPNLTARELLRLWGSFFRQRADADELLAQMGLTEARKSRVETLSGGQQQRLSIALALVGKPDILFLDEPTAGLDPQARRTLWEVIEGLKADGKTILLTTHYLDEAARLCDRVAILDKGNLLALDSPTQLIAAYHAPSTGEIAAPPTLEDVFLNLTGRAVRP